MAISKRSGREVRAARLGDARLVRNLLSLREAEDPARIEPDDAWYHVRLQFEDGHEADLLFTRFEILNAIKRARDNPEDVPKVNPLRNWLD